MVNVETLPPPKHSSQSNQICWPLDGIIDTAWLLNWMGLNQRMRNTFHDFQGTSMMKNEKKISLTPYPCIQQVIYSLLDTIKTLPQTTPPLFIMHPCLAKYQSMLALLHNSIHHTKNFVHWLHSSGDFYFALMSNQLWFMYIAWGVLTQVVQMSNIEYVNYIMSVFFHPLLELYHFLHNNQGVQYWVGYCF